MTIYRAPVSDIAHALKSIAGLDGEAFPGLGEDLVDAVLSEAGRFAEEEIAPLRLKGDRQGARLQDGEVVLPDGWKSLYRNWIEGGWNGIAAAEIHGGQGLPQALAVATLEMWNSGSMAFAIGPTLTMGAVEALSRHGSEALQALYLEKLVSGEFMGTMNLTEPQAGSDLGALQARAEPAGDGTYRLFGQKIFITYGEHDLTDNIIHLVLARLPDAPAGTRGISLFLVPKFLPDADGRPGERNDLHCQSLEHKMGIHASPTCTMIYGDGRFGTVPGAIGWLVGEENRGLACMFTMMNNARLAVGIQGVAVAEAAFQMAHAYAHERRQGKASAHSGPGMAPIVLHPDVQRDLLTMKALTQAARAIAYSCAHALDRAATAIEETQATFWQDRANLLTPIAKAFCTDIGVEVASLAVQVHGGAGYIEESGVAMLLRDARIAPIYEGTNGIQAIDLVTRKLPLAGGSHIAGFIQELAADAEAVRTADLAEAGRTADCIDAAIADLEAATAWISSALADGHQDAALAGATAYLRLIALTAGAAFLARGAVRSQSPERVALTRFMAENLLGQTMALRRTVMEGSASLAAAAELLLKAHRP